MMRELSGFDEAENGRERHSTEETAGSLGKAERGPAPDAPSVGRLKAAERRWGRIEMRHQRLHLGKSGREERGLCGL